MVKLKTLLSQCQYNLTYRIRCSQCRINIKNNPAMRDQDGRLARWGLPHDHFEIDISNFLEPQPKEILEVKCPQSYQATFGVLQGLCT
jgi:hypothetical protein